MKLARIFLLAALSIAAFAQELPKNLDIIHAKYSNEGIYNYGQAGPRTTGVWVAVFLLDTEIHAAEVTVNYEATTKRGNRVSRTSTQIINRRYPFSSWASSYFPVGDVEVKSITATALVETESNTVSNES